MTIHYPVAASADEALKSPLGQAARQREAAHVAGGPVAFVTEAVGSAYIAPSDALNACGAAANQPWVCVRPVASPSGPRALQHPVNKDGRRWPEPRRAEPTLYRVSISYWRVAGAEAALEDPARALRRDPGASRLDPAALRALARQPMRALKPQQPLDIGLFEVRPPEAPHILMPDE